MLGVFLIVGTVISYVPQYVSIIKMKSSEGLSYGMLSIALASGFLTAINSGILKWPNVICCHNHSLNLGQCLRNNMATEQLLAGLFCYILLYLLYLMYFRLGPDAELKARRRRTRLLAWITFFLIIFGATGLSILGGVLYYELNYTSTTVARYAQVLGIASSLLMVFQWAPQIYTTWKLKSQGSLSLGMLLLQIPGALLVVVYQGILNEADFTTWVPYLLGGMEQVVLVLMVIVYKYRAKRLAENPDERILLINKESKCC